MSANCFSYRSPTAIALPAATDNTDNSTAIFLSTPPACICKMMSRSTVSNAIILSVPERWYVVSLISIISIV